MAYRRTLGQWLGVFFTLLVTLPAAADCGHTGALQPIVVERVVDGDTLKLVDGRRVRLIGVNTPELGHGQRRDQPLAVAAKKAVDAFIGRGKPLTMVVGKERHDRHGRLLAHVYSAGGDNLEAYLLRQGLGFLIAIPPNVSLVDCLTDAEARARIAGLGVWAEPAYRPLDAAGLSTRDVGFRQVRGRIDHAQHSTYGWRLRVGKLSIRIPAADVRRFGGLSAVTDAKAIEGHIVTVRGWLKPSEGNDDIVMLWLRHPGMWVIE